MVACPVPQAVPVSVHVGPLVIGCNAARFASIDQPIQPPEHQTDATDGIDEFHSAVEVRSWVLPSLNVPNAVRLKVSPT